jgi:hypothetical protein
MSRQVHTIKLENDALTPAIASRAIEYIFNTVNELVRDMRELHLAKTKQQAAFAFSELEELRRRVKRLEEKAGSNATREDQTK